MLTGKETELSIRAFNEREKQEAYERQEHKCAGCGEELQRFDIQSLFSFAKRSSFAHLMEGETALMFFHKLDRFSEDIALDAKGSSPKVEKIRDFYDLAFLINQHPNFFPMNNCFK